MILTKQNQINHPKYDIRVRQEWDKILIDAEGIVSAEFYKLKVYLEEFMKEDLSVKSFRQIKKEDLQIFAAEFNVLKGHKLIFFRLWEFLNENNDVKSATSTQSTKHEEKVKEKKIKVHCEATEGEEKAEGYEDGEDDKDYEDYKHDEDDENLASQNKDNIKEKKRLTVKKKIVTHEKAEKKQLIIKRKFVNNEKIIKEKKRLIVKRKVINNENSKSKKVNSNNEDDENEDEAEDEDEDEEEEEVIFQDNISLEFVIGKNYS